MDTRTDTVTNRPTHLLTQAQIAQYERDGFLIVQGLYNAEDAASWKAALKTRLTADGRIDEPSGVVVMMADAMDAYTKRQIQQPNVLGVLEQLIGPDVEFLSVKAVFKNKQTSFSSPWHQDWFYWQGAPKISVWIALDDATPENGCLKLIPGSHRQVADMIDVEDGHGFGHRVADETIAGMTEVSAPVARGDAIFFHDLALHASCPNVNGADRWSAISTYRSGAAKDESTVWETGLVLRGRSVNF